MKRRITAKAGLLWVDGEIVGVPAADWLARDHGFVYAEQMVRDIMEHGECSHCKREEVCEDEEND